MRLLKTPPYWRRQLVSGILSCVLLLCPLVALAEPPSDAESEYRAGRSRDWLTRRTGTSLVTWLSGDGSFDFSHYATALETETLCQHWQTEYPDLVCVIPLGRSWQDRSLYAVRIGNHASGDPDTRPALYIDASHHAREPISSQVALYFCWWLLDNYAHDSQVRHLLDTRTVYVIPMVNPDGNDIWLGAHAEQRRTANPTCDDDGDGVADEDPIENAGYGSHYRYRYCFDSDWVTQHGDDETSPGILAPGWYSHVISQTYLGHCDAVGQPLVKIDGDDDGLIDEDPVGGVDPNRNYDYHWEEADPRPGSTTYRGPEAFSEPETRVVRDFCLAHENIATALTLHSGVDTILYPWAWTEGQTSPRAQFLNAIARKGSELSTCNGYDGARYGQASVALYQAFGTTADWLHALAIYSWTTEVYGSDDYLPSERIGETDCFYVKRSLAARFVPDPVDIPGLVDRWRRFLVYVLAATPNISISRVEADSESFWIEIANDGYLPVDVSIDAVTVNARVPITTCTELSAGRRWVSVPRAYCAATGTMTVTLSATSTIGNQARTIETSSLRVHTVSREDGGAAWIDGTATPWVDLTAFGNGSWDVNAGAWDAERYRLQRVVPRRQHVPLGVVR